MHVSDPAEIEHSGRLRMYSWGNTYVTMLECLQVRS